MQHPISFGAVVALAATTAFAQINSNLPRGERQLSVTPGVLNSTVANAAAPNLDAGFGMFKVASPRQFLTDRAGGLVATPRLVYATWADRIGGNVVLQFARSVDGGRSFGTATTIYTCNTTGGETLEAFNNNSTGDAELALVCHADEVYVTFLTDDLATPGAATGGQRLYAIGSADQGQTWSAPVLVSTQNPVSHYDVDAHATVAASTGLHLVWEHDDTGLPGGKENISYARLALAGAFLAPVIPATPITTHPMDTFDVDNPAIDADGNTVLIAWNDNSDPVAGTTQDNTFSIVSLDGGLAFSAPFNHTGYTMPSPWATARAPYCFVDGNFLFVFMEDSRVDQDDVWMDRADLVPGTSFAWSVRGVVCNRTPAGAGPDIDGMRVDVADGVIAIVYRDDRTGTANSNEGYVVVDRAAGQDLIAGTHTETGLGNLTITLYGIEVCGNMIAVVWEECGGDEEGALALSHDRGQTFTFGRFTTLGDCSPGGSNIDVDDLEVALTQNDDFVVAWSDERLGGATATNVHNAVFVSGGKYPFLVDRSLANATLEMHRVDPAEAFASVAFLMISGAGTMPGHAVLGNDYGFFVGLQRDLWFDLLLASPQLTFQSVGAAGDVLFTGIPNVSALLGLPIDVAGGTFQLGTRPLTSYTDPVRM